MSEQQDDSRHRQVGWRLLFWPLLVVLVAAALWLLPRLTGPRAELVTEELLRAKRSQWRAAGIDSYEIEVEVSGAQRGHYRVVVRDSRVVSASFDGRPLDQKRARYWTVHGQFGQIERELRNARSGKTWPEGVRVRIWASFDPTTGRPLWWQRQVQGGSQTVTVRTVAFRRLD